MYVISSNILSLSFVPFSLCLETERWKHHGAVDEPSSEQQFRKSYMITYVRIIRILYIISGSNLSTFNNIAIGIVVVYRTYM